MSSRKAYLDCFGAKENGTAVLETTRFEKRHVYSHESLMEAEIVEPEDYKQTQTGSDDGV
jgi:hypothetical protein